eukprot:5893084-Prymnesium_polylepis.1
MRWSTPPLPTTGATAGRAARAIRTARPRPTTTPSTRTPSACRCSPPSTLSSGADATLSSGGDVTPPASAPPLGRTARRCRGAPHASWCRTPPQGRTPAAPPPGGSDASPSLRRSVPPLGAAARPWGAPARRLHHASHSAHTCPPV